MSIRVRLVLVSLLVALPVAGVVAAYLVAARIHDTRMGLVDWVQDRVRDPLFQARCQGGDLLADAGHSSYVLVRPDAGQGGPTLMPAVPEAGPYRLFAFDATLQRPFPAAALVPTPVMSSLATSSAGLLSDTDAKPMAVFYSEPNGSSWYARTTGWSGACAFVVATGPVRAWPGWRDARSLAVLIGVVFVAAFVSGGAVVKRVRALTRSVRESAESGYETPIPVHGRDEIATLARTFNEAGAGLRQQLTAVADREATLREFVANTGHDVATPLSVLQSHLAALEARQDLADDARDEIAAAIRETHYAGSILRNLAAIARLDTPGWVVTMAPTDLVALAERVVSRHRPAARASRVGIDAALPSTPVVIDADATLLEQAVSNLVDNAIRYNRPGGHVGVSLDPDGDRFLLRVVDDGPGVSEGDLASLGTRSFRTDEARSRRPDGQGLGLDIACDVVRRLGLSIVFRRRSAGGLEVEIAGRAEGG